jgi:hypothetical protein
MVEGSGTGAAFMVISVYTISYFALLGIGFMCVEIALIQKLILLLENPSYALATVLAALLVSSGTGSLLGTLRSKRRLPATAAAGIISAGRYPSVPPVR